MNGRRRINSRSAYHHVSSPDAQRCVAFPTSPPHHHPRPLLDKMLKRHMQTLYIMYTHNEKAHTRRCAESVERPPPKILIKHSQSRFGSVRQPTSIPHMHCHCFRLPVVVHGPNKRGYCWYALGAKLRGRHCCTDWWSTETEFA